MPQVTKSSSSTNTNNVSRRNRQKKNKSDPSKASSDGTGTVASKKDEASSDTGLGSSPSSSSSNTSTLVLEPTEENVGISLATTLMELRKCPCSTPAKVLDDFLTEIDEEFEDEEDEAEEDNRIRLLLLQNAKAKLLLQKNKKYNKILSMQKEIRSQQLHILRKANALNSMFVRSMEAILHLGHCPSALQDRTDIVSHGLIDVHNTIHRWDEKLEIMILNSKDKKSMLNAVFQLFSDKFGKEVEALTVEEFKTLYQEMDGMPELFCDEKDFTELFKEVDMTMAVNEEWEIFRLEVEAHLRSFEVEFRGICLEYGIRSPNPKGGCPNNNKDHIVYKSQL